MLLYHPTENCAQSMHAYFINNIIVFVHNIINSLDKYKPYTDVEHVKMAKMHFHVESKMYERRKIHRKMRKVCEKQNK